VARYIGMYRRSQLIRSASEQADGYERAIAARLILAFNCARGKHRQETDADTGNEVCGICGEIIDDYSDLGF
jgi:hypothetical protein